MKYGTVIRLLTVACLAIVQLTGCSSDVEEMEEAAPGIPIRIVAEMNRGGGTSRTVGVPARLSGEWKENYIGAEEYEKTVKHVLLLQEYRELSGKSPFLLSPGNGQSAGRYNRH